MKSHQKHLSALLDKTFPHFMYGVEVGVWRGETSAHLLCTHRNLYLYLVDPWQAWPADSEYAKCDKMGKLSQAEWDVICKEAAEAVVPFMSRFEILRQCSEAASRHFVPASLDFVFLDGDHTYAGVRKDLEVWEPKIRAGGILCGHDYRPQGDRRPTYGVAQAVHEFFGKAAVKSHRGLLWSWEKS